MAVPGMRHGHMDALCTEKRNPTVFTRQKNLCVSPDRVGGGPFGLGQAGDPDDEAPHSRRTRRAGRASRGGRP